MEVNFKRANALFKKRRFSDARALYEILGRKYGRSTVNYNISLCDKNLGNFFCSKDEYPLISVAQYFDCIYLVNLETQKKKKITALRHLFEYGVKVELINAVNGYVGDPLKTYEDYKSRKLGELKRYPEFNEREVRRGKGFIESPGAVGYIYTYVNIMREAKSKGHKKILILEDDVLLDKNFGSKFSSFVTQLPETWKVLQLGASQYDWSSVDLTQAIHDGFYFPRQLDTCGSFALALDSDVFELLIEAVSAFEAPFDHLPLGEVYEKYLGECFVAYPNIVMPSVADSSIRGGRCQITHGAKMKWQIANFDYPLDTPSVNILIQSKESLKYYSNFSDSRSLPFSLRLFIYTEDGLRPLHQSELLNYEYNHLKSIEQKLMLPVADYSISCPKNVVLTEEMIYDFVQYKLLKKDNAVSSLEDLEHQAMRVIKGRISVIIPTYKRPKNLKNALFSVATQDYDNKEIIVVCDNGEGSEYNAETKAIVESVKSEYPEIDISLIYHQRNRNGAAARNTGFLNSSGEYICLLDDDDIYLPGRLSKSVAALSGTSKDFGAVYCGFLGWNSPENNVERYAEGDLTKEILQLDYMKHYLHTNTATYKRSAYEVINGFDESYRRHQDLEFNLRFFEHYKIKAVKEALVRLNPEPSDISNKVFDTSMLILKEKFLGQFADTIDSFEESTARNIYLTHWGEAIKYVSDVNTFREYLKGLHYNGPLQISLNL